MVLSPPTTARQRCIEALADPSCLEKPEASIVHLFADVSEEFFTKHGAKLKPRTLEEYRRHTRLYLIPAFGKRPIDAITKADVNTAHSSWKDNPRAANHALAILSKMMNWAEDHGLRPDDSNPCSRIQKFKENQRERLLSEIELQRLGRAIDQAEAESLLSLYQITAIRLLILHGARLNEILTLKWDYVDLERKLLLLPDSKTGKKAITLNEPALHVLQHAPRLAGNSYVIVGSNEGEHLVNLQKPWRRLRKLAELDDVRLHDLRHAFASWAVAGGASLPIIGRQLGHSQASTTQRYAHLADDPVRKATENTAQRISAALSNKPSHS